MIESQIKDFIHAALIALNLPPEEVKLDHPANESHGDFSTNIALALYPKLKQEGSGLYANPRQLAQAIADQLQITIKPSGHSAIESCSVAGPGFINFAVKPDYWVKSAQDLLSQQEAYGRSNSHSDKLAIVEYSSPNIAKPFTIGHLRSTIIGDAIANLLEAVGWHVMRDNHIGDWGTQFGKLLYAIKTWGNERELEHSENPVKDLVDLYVRFHQEAESQPQLNDDARAWFKRLEAGDAEARNIWQQCINWSFKEFQTIYEILGVSFSQEFEQGRGLGESFFETKMETVINELKTKNLLKEGKEGAQLFFFENDIYPPAMILKKDGTTLYHTRDLATDKYRLDHYQPQIIINEVGAEQTLYFQQLFQMEYQLGWYQPGQRLHIGHGLIRFKDKKMSTRKGDVIWLQDVLSEAVSRAKNLQKDTPAHNPQLSQQVAVGALKWNDLKGSPKRDILFDWDEILNMKGNSGPYVQYTHARCCSVLTKSGLNIDKLSSYPVNQLTLNSEELSLLRWFPRYPEVVSQAAQTYSPHVVCTYLYELSQRFNTFYNRHTILGTADKPINRSTGQLRLILTAATAQILKNGLSLLGIAAPREM